MRQRQSNYYQNPKTRDLILYDSESGEIFVIEHIEKVHVMVGSEVQQGDFKSSRKQPMNYDILDGEEKYQNYNLKKRKGWKCPDCSKEFWTRQIGNHKSVTKIHGAFPTEGSYDDKG